MEKNEVFTFTDPNGIELLAVVIDSFNHFDCNGHQYVTNICYGPNQIFTYEEKIQEGATPVDVDENGDEIFEWQSWTVESHYGKVLVEYAILPDYDETLEDYQHQLDMADDHAAREV